MENLVKKDQIQSVLNRYAEACDRRNWQILEEIFHPDVEVNYGGEYRLVGCDALVSMIKRLLGGCGPTQHLLGNFDISVDGDLASCRCYVRAAHQGAKGKEDLLYEVWAEYIDKLVLENGAWCITEREMKVYNEVGSRDVLAPAVS